MVRLGLGLRVRVRVESYKKYVFEFVESVEFVEFGMD